MIESSPPDYRFSFRNVNGFPVVAASDNLYRLRMREKHCRTGYEKPANAPGYHSLPSLLLWE